MEINMLKDSAVLLVNKKWNETILIFFSLNLSYYLRYRIKDCRFVNEKRKSKENLIQNTVLIHISDLK